MPRRIRVKENRKNFRLPLSNLFLVVIRDSRSRQVPGLVLDVGVGGARLLTQSPLSLEEGVELFLESSRGLVVLQARVAWEKRYLLKFVYGVEFPGKRLDPLARQIFLDFENRTQALSSLRKLVAMLPGSGKERDGRSTKT